MVLPLGSTSKHGCSVVAHYVCRLQAEDDGVGREAGIRNRKRKIGVVGAELVAGRTGSKES